MGRSGAAVWGIDVICGSETSAQKQKARGDAAAGIVEKVIFQSSLRSD